MPPKHDDAVVSDATNRPQTWVENLGLRVGTVVAIIAAILTVMGGTGVAIIVWGTNLQNDVRGVQRDVTAIKVSVAGLNQINELQLKYEDLRKNGSDAVKAMEKDLDQLRTDLKVHLLTTPPGGK